MKESFIILLQSSSSFSFRYSIMLWGMTTARIIDLSLYCFLTPYLVFGVACSHSAYCLWPSQPIKNKKTELFDTTCPTSSVLTPFNTLSLNQSCSKLQTLYWDVFQGSTKISTNAALPEKSGWQWLLQVATQAVQCNNLSSIHKHQGSQVCFLHSGRLLGPISTKMSSICYSIMRFHSLPLFPLCPPLLLSPYMERER